MDQPKKMRRTMFDTNAKRGIRIKLLTATGAPVARVAIPMMPHIPGIVRTPSGKSYIHHGIDGDWFTYRETTVVDVLPSEFEEY